MKNYSKYQVATAIAILFHTIGLVGILVFKSDLIIQSTPINLLLSFGLLIWTQPEKNSWFYGFLILTAIVGFGVEVIFHDLIPDLSDEFGTQVSLETLQKQADILSIHLPITPETHYIINAAFISKMQKDFYFVNTARGKNVKTSDLVEALKSGHIKGAALDVLEYEKASFENIELKNDDLHYLLHSEKAIVTPHIGGWTIQSKEKLAQVIVDKILADFSQF